MSTTYLNRLFTGREATMDERERRYIEHYLIRTTSNTEDPREVWHTPGTPRGGDSYGSDLASVVRSISVKLAVPYDWQYWIKTCTFSTKPFDPFNSGQKPGPPTPQGGFNDNSPTLETPVVRTSAAQREIPATHDYYGKPYRSSSGTPFKGATKEQTTFILELDRNVDQTQRNIQYQYLKDGGATNSETFAGVAAGKWRVASWTSESRWRGGGVYDKEHFGFHYREEGWRRHFLDEGFWHQNSSSLNITIGSNFMATQPTVATDAYGNAMGGPVLLDGRGNRLSDINTVLTAPLAGNAAATGVSVASTTNFPQTIEIQTQGHRAGRYLRIDNEILQIVSLGLGTFTVFRGARGSTVAAHLTDAGVYLDAVFLEFVEYPELPFNVLGTPF